MSPRGLAGFLLLGIAMLVPENERPAWRQQWLAELWVLSRRRPGMGHQLSLVLSLIPQALWERKEWLVEVALQDVRFALRQLARSPGFTVVAVLTMAVGIGATTLIFSLANATLLRSPAGISRPERILQIGRDRAAGFDNLAYPYASEFREHADALDAVAVYFGRTMAFGRGEATRSVNGQMVSGDFFRLLGVQATIGRVLSVQDDLTRGAHPVVVVSHDFWNNALGGDAGAVGREIVVNGAPFTVVGVTPAGFLGTDVMGEATDLWLPMSMVVEVLGERFAGYDNPGFSWLWVLGRLREGAMPTAAAAQLQTLYAARFEEAWGDAPDEPLGIVQGVGLRPDERVQVERMVGMMAIIVVVMLLITAANLAGLLLARGVGRGGELGVRVALGAGRSRLVRQLMTESLLLAAAGGALAAILTFWTVRLLPSLLPTSLGVSVAPDLRVLAFAGGVSLITGLVFGLVPALRASRADTVTVLKEGARLSGGHALWMRGALVVVQVALSFTLLAGTALMTRSLAAADRTNPGFETRSVLGMTLDLDTAGYDASTSAAFIDRVMAEASFTGADAVGASTGLLFGGWMRRSVFGPEALADENEGPPEIDYAAVTPGWFATMGIPLLRGEGFHAGNSGTDMPRVVVLSESTAALLFPGGDALGRLMPRDETRSPDNAALVVGIVPDIQNRSLRTGPRPAFYEPFAQSPRGFVTVVARGPRPAELTTPLRQVLSRLDPDLAVLRVDTVHAAMVRSLGETRVIARLAATFAAVAAFLAAIGLYGVVAYIALSRSGEIGLRMALGAQAGSVRAMILVQGMKLALVGVVLGLLSSLAAGGLLGSLLYGLSSRDPASLLIVGGALLALTAAASLIPARRASRIDPALALRTE